MFSHPIFDQTTIESRKFVPKIPSSAQETYGADILRLLKMTLNPMPEQRSEAKEIHEYICTLKGGVSPKQTVQTVINPPVAAPTPPTKKLGGEIAGQKREVQSETNMKVQQPHMGKSEKPSATTPPSWKNAQGESGGTGEDGASEDFANRLKADTAAKNKVKTGSSEKKQKSRGKVTEITDRMKKMMNIKSTK